MPSQVNLSYLISIMYCCGDVVVSALEQHAATPNELRRILRTALHAVLFEGFATMLFPAIFMHTFVHLVHDAVAFYRLSGPLWRWLPTTLGLALIPALPLLFDHPVEVAVDALFSFIGEVQLNMQPRLRLQQNAKKNR